MRARAHALAAIVAAGLLTGCGQVACQPGEVCVVLPEQTPPPARELDERPTAVPLPILPKETKKPKEKERRTVGFHVRRGDNSLLMAYVQPGFNRSRLIERIEERGWQHLEHGVIVGSRVSMEVVGLPHVDGDCWITINGREASSLKRPDGVEPFIPRSGFADGTCEANAVVY